MGTKGLYPRMTFNRSTARIKSSERKQLDQMMTALQTLVEETEVTIIIASPLNGEI